MNLAAAAATSGSNPLPLLLILIVSLAGIAAYWVPTIVAVVRKVPNVGTVVIIDLFLGWTFVGWVVALAMALRDPRPAAPPGYPGPQYLGQQPPPGYAGPGYPGQQPSAGYAGPGYQGQQPSAGYAGPGYQGQPPPPGYLQPPPVPPAQQ